MSVLFGVCAVGLAIALIVVVTQNNSKTSNATDSAAVSKAGDSVCTTAGCVKAAGIVLDGLDETVSPCEDFSKFACGNWVRKNLIPEDKSSYVTFTKLRDQVNVQIKALLEEARKSDDPTAVDESKDMYQACLDEETIETLGVQPLLDLHTRLGEWPMVTSSWDEGSFDLIDTLVELRLLNNKYLINSYVSADDKNSSNYMLMFSQMSFGLPSREYYLDSKYVDEVAAYKQFIIDTATFLNDTLDRVNEDAQDIIDFETYMANISRSKAERRDPVANYNKLTVGELTTNVTDQFEWLRYINTLFSHVNHTFTDSSELVIHSPEYFRNMAEKVKTTPKRTLANYLLWRLTIYRLSNLPTSLQDIKKKFNKVLYGVSSDPARWDKCVGYTSSFMGMAVGRLFVSKHFNEKARDSALEMIDGIRQSFDELLETVPWMNANTRTVAKEKSKAIRNRIGYPDWMFNNTALNSEYEGLIGRIRPNTHFENNLNALNSACLKSLKNIKKPVDHEEFPVDPAVVNAYYQSSENQISFPAGILQPPFWQQDRPISMNYGAIGTVIGHEITHGFDDMGRQYDKEGNLLEWWDKEVIDAFDDAKQCIVDQYGSYVVPQINRTLNGENTQGENIADNGGIKQSYRAFLRWQAKHGEGERLPGLQKYSPNQLFVIAFAQVWCGTYRDQSLNIALEEGSHSPGMFRIIGTLSNFPDFSKLFQCPVGSKMNPQKKCSVW